MYEHDSADLELDLELLHHFSSVPNFLSSELLIFSPFQVHYSSGYVSVDVWMYEHDSADLELELQWYSLIPVALIHPDFQFIYTFGYGCMLFF